MAHFEKELERQEVYRGCIFTLTSHRVGLDRKSTRLNSSH